jgi:hypothetical protein
MKKPDRNIQSFRFQKTLNFISAHISKNKKILDLGDPNLLGQFLQKNGFQLDFAYGFDFDLIPEKVNEYNYDVLTAFEVLEHLVNPFSILQKTKASQLVVSIPLSLWFAKAHRNIKDPYDQHFHEFESWQFNMLLEKAGWKIKDREKWTPPLNFTGARSILRAVTPRFYAVYAER